MGCVDCRDVACAVRSALTPLKKEVSPMGSFEKVEHPKHYNSGGIEVWDAIIAWDLDFLLGNVVKYVARAGRKPGESAVNDLLKARQYLDKEIEAIKAKGGNNEVQM